MAAVIVVTRDLWLCGGSSSSGSEGGGSANRIVIGRSPSMSVYAGSSTALVMPAAVIDSSVEPTGTLLRDAGVPGPGQAKGQRRSNENEIRRGVFSRIEETVSPLRPKPSEPSSVNVTSR